MSQFLKDEGGRIKDKGKRAFRLPPSDFILFSATLALYTFTLAPGLLPADSGEYQTTGAILGVAHPPGYAAYTLLSWLISRVPFVSPAVAINFLSALLAAFTLVCVSRAVRVWTGSTFAGISAALALGFSTTFWAQATTTNIRMFTAFGVALALTGLAKSFPGFPASGNKGNLSKSAIATFAFGLGLAISHHGSTAFLAGMLALYFLIIYALQDWSVLRLMWAGGLPKRAGLPTLARQLWPLAAGLIPFLSWGYFLFRTQAFGALENAGTWDGFLDQVFARDALGAVAVFATPELFPDRLRVLWVILNFQWHWLVLLGVAVGFVLLVFGNWKLGFSLFLAFAIHTFFSITYAAPQTAEYLLPSYVLMAVPLGFALARPPTRPPAHLLIPAVAIIGLAVQFSNNFPGYRTLAQDDSTGEFTRDVLIQAPPNAVILAHWHWATPLWYLQQVEGWRPDVSVRYVFPRGASYAQNWVDDARAELPARPVIVTSFFKPEYAASGLRFAPLATPHFPAWQVSATPPLTATLSFSNAQSFGELNFLGFTPIITPQFSNRQFSVLAAWQLNAPPRDINFFIQAIGPDGLLYGQQDVSYAASRYASGEILLDRYDLQLMPNAPAGAYRFLAGAYLPSGERVAEQTLATFNISAPPAPLEAGTNFGGQILLTQARFTPTTARPGERVTVELEFVALRPISQDLVVTLKLNGAGWRTQLDTVAVGGGLPTLKWVTGTRVHDTFILTVPPTATPGPAELTVGWYDMFTQNDLAVLTESTATLGSAVPLGPVEILAPE